MPSNTDTRIVQMQFDNKDFEKNIATSEKSLEKFKEALNFQECEKSLEDFEDATRKLTFDQMASNIQKLADKFTGLGTVSEYVLSQIRHGLESAAAKAKAFFNSMTIEQVNAGFEKFGQLNKNVQTIMAATGRSEEDVYKVMQRLNDYTDQTSYSFTDMASNIGKFTSVGINLEDAEKQMEGIANWAARSGGGIQEASRAMYNLSQAMGVGALTKIDWKSIENAGMATKEFKEQLIQAGLAEGTLVREGNKILTSKAFGKQVEVSYQNLAETLSKKWADTAVMQRSFMAYYYDDLYYEGTETLIKVTDAQIKILEDAFADGKAITRESWKTIENQGLATKEVKEAAIEAAVAQKNLVKETTKDGKVIYKTAQKYGKQIEVTLDNFEESLKTGWLDKGVAKNVWAFDNLARSAYESAQKCTTFTDVLNAWKDQLSTGWMTSYTHIFGELSESMELFSNICNKVGTALDKLLKYRNRLLELWGNGGGRENLWGLIVGEVAEDGEVLAYEGAYGFLDVLMDIGGLIKEGFWNMLKLFAPDDVLSVWDNENARDGWIASQMDQIVIKIRNFIAAIHDFFNASSDGSQKSRWQQIQDVVNAIYAAFVLAYTVIRDVVGFLGKLFDQDHLGKSMDSILKLLSALGLGVYEMADSAVEGEGLEKLFNGLLASLEPLIAAVNTFVDILTGGFIEGIEKGKEAGTFAGIWQTICDIFSLLGKIVSKVGAPVLNFVSSVLGIINDLFDGELTGDKLKELGGRLETAITKLFDDIFSLIPGIGKNLQSTIAYIFGFAEEGAEEGADESSKTIIGVAKQWLRKIFGGFAKVYDNIKGDAEQYNLFTWIKDMLGIGSFGKFLGELGGLIKGTNMYGLIMNFLKIFALLKLIGTLRQGTGLFRNLRGFFQGAQDVMKDGLKLKFGDQLESVGDKVLKIASGIALIAAAVAVLGSMSVDSLTKGFIALVLVMTALGGFMLIMKNFILKDWKDAIGLSATIAAVAAAILSITVGIGLLITMLRPLAGMEMGGIVNMLTGLLGVVAILGLTAKYIGKDLKNVKGAGSIAALALSIGLLILALRPLANMEWEGMAKMALGLVGILYILTEFSNKVGNMSIKGGGSLILLAASIGLLIMSLMSLKDLGVGQLLKMGASLFAILEILARFTKKAFSMKGKGMGQLVLVAGSIWILMQALLPLANLEWEQLGKIEAGLAATMLIIGLFINNTQSMQGTGMGNILMVAASIWVLMQALLPLANIEWEGLAKMGVGLLVVAGIVTAMTHLLGEMNILQGASTAVMLVGLAAVLLTFGFAMSSLTGVSWEKISVACTWLVAIIASFAAIQKEMLKDNDILDAVHSLILLAGLALIMIAFSIALNEIKNVPTDKIEAFSAGLALLTVGIAKALELTKGLSLTGALKGILILSVALAALMAVFAIVGNFTMNTIGSGLTSLAAHLKTFSGLISDFSTRMNNVDEQGIEKAKRVVGMLVSLLGDIGGIVIGTTSASALTYMSANLKTFSGMIVDFSTRMNRVDEDGVKKAQRIVGLLVELLSDIEGITIGTESATSLTDISADLKTTSGMLVDFGTRMANADEAAFAKAKRIVQQVNGIMAELEGFDGFTTDREAFTTALFDLGTGIEIFATHTGNAGDLSTNSALQLIKDLSGCADDLETIAGMNIANLTASLSGLGGAMMLYARGAEEATGLNVQAEGAPDVAGAVKLMQDISQALAENGGFAIPESMPSEEALGTFGAQLAALAGALVMFEEAGSQLGDGTEEALKALDFFKDLKAKLVEIDMGKSIGTALAAFITGENVQVQPSEMETFGKNIEQLGKALAAFAKSTTVMDEATGEIVPVDYSVAVSALQSFSELANSLPTIGGIRGWLEGNKQSLSDLGHDLQILGQDLKDFSMAVTGKNTDDEYEGFGVGEIEEGKTAAMGIVDKAVEVAGQIAEIQTKLGTIGGITSIWTGEQLDLGTFSVELEILGQNLKDFSMAVTGKSTDDDYEGFGVGEIEEGKLAAGQIVDKAVEVFGKIVEIQTSLKDFKKGGFVSIWEGDEPDISSISVQLETLGQNLSDFSDMVTGAREGSKPFDPEASKAALGLVDQMIDIMTQMSTKLPKVGGLGNILETFTEGRDSSLTDVGNQIGGLADGLSSFGTAVNGKFNDMDSVINALQVVDTVIGLISSLADIHMTYSNVGTYVDYINEFLGSMTSTQNNMNGNIWDDTIVNYIVSMMEAMSQAVNEAQNIDSESVDVFTTFTEGLRNLASINLAEISKQFEDIGANISAGVQLGIEKGQAGVITAAVEMATAAYLAAKAALDEHSPSRIFMGLGRFASEGLAIGIQQSTGLAENAGEAMANSTINSTKGILAGMSAALLDDVDMQPTIRPVLDLSNVAAGSSAINGMFGRSYGIGLNTIGASNRASRSFTPAVVADVQNGTEMESMMSRMDAMLENIQKMGDGMTNMKLVLDTGVVAGGVVDDIDADIGRRMFYAGRRN